MQKAALNAFLVLTELIITVEETSLFVFDGHMNPGEYNDAQTLLTLTKVQVGFQRYHSIVSKNPYPMR